MTYRVFITGSLPVEASSKARAIKKVERILASLTCDRDFDGEQAEDLLDSLEVETNNVTLE